MSSSSRGILAGSISGFIEFLPKDQITFNRCIDIIKHEFESFGFIPMDTPAVEKATTLLSKGNDNEIYGLCRLTAQGVEKKELGLRFDLTVPLARYVAEHSGQLIFPFKRYHIAPVWRGERAQAGRYRQFTQCDIDVIGEGELSLSYDAELLAIAYRIFENIGLKNYRININNRKVLVGLMKSFSVDEDKIDAVIRQIDKKDKIEPSVMMQALKDFGLFDKTLDNIQEFLSFESDNESTLQYLKEKGTDPLCKEGISEIEELLHLAKSFKVDMDCLQIDPTLARGLNYYTGTIYEAKWLDCKELGSILGGGRYQNLAATFTKKMLPGVGISIGVSRLIPKMIEKGLITSDTQTLCKVLMTVQSRQHLDFYIALSEKIRSLGVGVEVYLQDKPLSNQLKYADKKGFEIVLIANQEEIHNKVVNVKFLKTNEQRTISIDELDQFISG